MSTESLIERLSTAAAEARAGLERVEFSLWHPEPLDADPSQPLDVRIGQDRADPDRFVAEVRRAGDGKLILHLGGRCEHEYAQLARALAERLARHHRQSWSVDLDHVLGFIKPPLGGSSPQPGDPNPKQIGCAQATVPFDGTVDFAARFDNFYTNQDLTGMFYWFRIPQSPTSTAALVVPDAASGWTALFPNSTARSSWPQILPGTQAVAEMVLVPPATLSVVAFGDGATVPVTVKAGRTPGPFQVNFGAGSDQYEPFDAMGGGFWSNSNAVMVSSS